MDAALALFLEKGIAGTIIDEIVSKAGASKGTFYHYFSSKNDIVAALRERFSRTFREGTQAAVDSVPDNDWSGKLKAWTITAVTNYLEQHEVHDVVYHEQGDHNRANVELAAMLAQIESLVSGGCRAKAWNINNTKLASVVIFSSMHGAVDDAINKKNVDRNALIGDLLEIFRRVLGGKS